MIGSGIFSLRPQDAAACVIIAGHALHLLGQLLLHSLGCWLAAMVMRVCSLVGVLHLVIGECLPVVHARKLLCIVG